LLGNTGFHSNSKTQKTFIVHKLLILSVLPFVLLVSSIYPADLPGPGDDEHFILFDRSSGEGHAGETWAIDDDEPVPLPAVPWGEDKWLGSISPLAYRLYLTGRYSIESLPPGGSITWKEGDNQQDLSLFNLLVICEPHNEFSPQAVDAVRSFIVSGHSVVLVGGWEEGGERGGCLGVLNGLLAGLFDGEGGPPGFSIADGPQRLELTFTGGDMSSPFLDGPFGHVSRLSLDPRIGIGAGGLEDGVIEGPRCASYGPLLLSVPLGAGSVILVSDSDLLVTEQSGGNPVDNVNLFLNVVAYALDDQYQRPAQGAFPSLNGAMQAKWITEDGATLIFHTNEPAWAVAELEGPENRVVACKGLTREHDFRIDGLREETNYRVTLHLLDGWGRQAPSSSYLSFRTLPPGKISYGDVTISEVFWGGDNQFIELYNRLDRAVDLRGWTLMSKAARYRLRGFVDAGSFYLLTRYPRETVGGDTEVYGDKAKDLVLDPTGDFIILQDEAGDVVSTANMSGGVWPAGRAGSRDAASMERVVLDGPDEAENWETALVPGSAFQETPGYENSRKGVHIFNPDFSGAVVEEGIRLTWSDNFGDSVLSVNIYRSSIRDGAEGAASPEYTRLNDTPIHPDIMNFLDADTRNSMAYQYLLGAVFASGRELFSEPLTIRCAASGLPKSIKVSMRQNFPNPFNPQTEIKFSVEDTVGQAQVFPLQATITIFNVRGQQIKVLPVGSVVPGEYSIRWDGRDDNGEPASSGSYYYRLTITRPGTQEVILQLSKKMVLLR